jgi:hypothetical protein
MLQFMNFTPHPVVIRRPDGSDQVIPPEPVPARVAQLPAKTCAIPGHFPVPLVSSPEFGEVTGLPAYAPEDETVMIVSALVLARCPGRIDVFAPATGPSDEAVRDGSGRIVAVTRLVAAPETWADHQDAADAAPGGAGNGCS